MVKEAGTTLRPDVVRAIEAAQKSERHEGAKHVLELIEHNAASASSDFVPLCQDTGTTWVKLSIGSEIALSGDVVGAINDAVKRGSEDAALRRSIVVDSLIDRTNTGTNTPAFIEYEYGSAEGLRIDVMLKGAGSDNASRVVMLNPEQGFDRILTIVRGIVFEKGAMACPPLIIGVGVGATFDKVAGLAKKALLREVGTVNPNSQLAEYEEILLKTVNETGIGPAGLGGDITALAVHIETAPSHIAALPLAVNMGCSAMRSCTRYL
jgi:fumarate hydratase class I/fumarate hydratase subunit alpha